MAVDLKRYRFTRDDYHRMAQTGILKPDARVELIDGEIVEMSPIGSRHMAAESLSPLAFPNLLVSVDDVLGPPARPPRRARRRHPE